MVVTWGAEAEECHYRSSGGRFSGRQLPVDVSILSVCGFVVVCFDTWSHVAQAGLILTV